MQSFSEHWSPREGEEGPLLLRERNSSHLVPLPASETRCADRATRTRPQARRGCSYSAPPARQDLRRPPSGHGSERPPAWALRGPPARVRLPLTSLGGEDQASLAVRRQQLSASTRAARPGPGAERRRRRELPSEPGAGPAGQRPGRPLAAAPAAPFCSSSS